MEEKEFEENQFEDHDPGQQIFDGQDVTEYAFEEQDQGAEESESDDQDIGYLAFEEQFTEDRDEEYNDEKGQDREGYADSEKTAGDFDFPETDDDFSDEFDGEEDERGSFEDEYTVRTTSFFEQYGDELKAAVRDIDEKEIFSKFDDEELEEGIYQFPEKKRKKKHWLVKILSAAVILAAVVIFMMSSYFNIKTIKVEGEKTIKAEEIIKMSGIKSGMNIFKVRESKVSKNLKKDAYFSSVKISRKLPDKLTITVRERNESAFILYGSERVIIDNEGYVLRKTKKKVRLTRLDDLKIKKMEMGEKLQTSDEDDFDKLLSMVTSMKNANLFFKKITKKKTIVRAYIKDDFLCRGKADNIIKNLDNGNLGSVIKDLYSKGKRKGTIILSDDNMCSYSPKVH